jgi:hypothetical protein
VIKKAAKKIEKDPSDILNKKLKELEERRKVLFKLKEPIDKELTANYNKINKIKDEIGKVLITKTPSNWNLLLDEQSGEFVYKKYSEKLNEKGLIGGGYLPDTGQRCIKIAMIKGDKSSFSNTFTALNEILPFIKSITKGNNKGFKYVDILESTLSENGCYYILLNRKEKIYKLMQDRYHHTSELKIFNSLIDILKYIQNNHWYELCDLSESIYTDK